LGQSKDGGVINYCREGYYLITGADGSDHSTLPIKDPSPWRGDCHLLDPIGLGEAVILLPFQKLKLDCSKDEDEIE